VPQGCRRTHSPGDANVARGPLGIVGWAMSDRISRQLTLDALGMALARRGHPLEGGPSPSGEGAEAPAEEQTPRA